jgi:hypothetical protein
VPDGLICLLLRVCVLRGDTANLSASGGPAE